MKIIVTGGAGFIGSSFIFHMLKHHPEDKISFFTRGHLRQEISSQTRTRNYSL